MIFPLCAKMLDTIVWTSEPLLAGEMAPTSLRNVFFGTTQFAGEIGSYTAPYMGILVCSENRSTFLVYRIFY